MTRLPVLIRQTQVFDLVVAGRTYSEICDQLQISEDTVARDMAAIDQQVRELARDRAGEVLAVALANYQKVIDLAWHEFHLDVQRQRDWFSGLLDIEQETVVTKTLAVAGEGADGDVDDEGEAFHQESAPLEVKRTRRRIRPQIRSERATWLALVVQTTGAMTELMGLKKLIVEHQGDGKPVEHVHMTLEQWKEQARARLQAAEQTYALLGDDAEEDINA